MAATLISSDQARVALLRLPLPLVTRLEPSLSPLSLLSKPCIPPALGPRPTEALCSPPSLSPGDSYHHRRYSHDVPQDVTELERSPGLKSAHAESVYQWTNGISALTRDLLWFRSTSNVGTECDRKTTAPLDIADGIDLSSAHRCRTLMLQLLQDSRHMEHRSHSPLSSPATDLVKQLHSLNESRGQWQYGSVVLQQADRLEHAQEPHTLPTAEQPSRQEEKGLSQKQLERRGEQPGEKERRGRLPSDKPTPAQMSVILLKLREEV